MKRLIAFLFVTMAFINFECTTPAEVSPLKISTLPGKFAMPVPVHTGNKISGALVWDGTNYEADFGSGGTLVISGPNPLPAPGITPIFNVLSSSSGGLISNGPAINTFQETIEVAVADPLNPDEIALDLTEEYIKDGIADVIREWVEGSGEEEEDDDRMSAGHISAPARTDALVQVTLFGKIIYVGGSWYAVASSYQIPTSTPPANPVMPLTPAGNGSGSTSAISTFLGGSGNSKFTADFEYSYDQNTWHSFGPSMNFDADDVVYFAGKLTNTTATTQVVSITVKALNNSQDSEQTLAPGETSARVALPTSMITSSGFLLKILAN